MVGHMSGVCGVLNSGNLAEWLTGVATFLLVVVAYRQLGRFIDNERMKNTLQYLRLYQDVAPMGGRSMTPLDAVELLAFQARQSDGERAYGDRLIAITIASNFFSETSHLLDRGQIDRSLFVSILCRQIVNYADALLQIENDPNYAALRTTDPGFRELILDARRTKERLDS
jgi:hypothetical protein